MTTAVKLIISLVLAISNFISDAHADCMIPSSYIENSNRVMMTRDVRGNYQLLLRDSVPNGVTLHMLCNANGLSTANCGPNGGNFSPGLPNAACNRPRAVVQDISRMSPNRAYGLYRVGYQFGTNFAELYRTAYNKNNLQAKYTLHTSYAGNRAVTTRPGVDFTLDGIMTGREAASFGRREIRARFNALLGAGQRYILNDRVSVFDRGHLAPSADFLYDHDKRATFKVLNVVPQVSTINRGNWGLQVETWTRRMPANAPRGSRHVGYRVVTGGHDVLTLAHSTNARLRVPMFLLDGNKNPIPRWTYKVVQKMGSCTVFVTYNNVWDRQRPAPICQVVNCPAGVTLDNAIDKGRTYCCDVRDFRRRVLPELPIC